MRLHRHVGQRLARQARLLALVERAEARRQFGLQRKSGQQLLAKTMDGLDAQPAAGRFQHFGEQTPGIVARLRPGLLAQRLQVVEQVDLFHLHPGGQAIMDAVGHFRRARLGEGEAQDIFRPDPLQQQTEDARGQHMGLAGPGRRRQPDMGVGRSSARLIAQQFLERAGLSHRRGHTIPPAA